MRWICSISVAVFLGGCATALGQHELSADPEYGRQARVEVTGGNVNGELLAVGEDSLWVLANGGLAAIPQTDVRRVRVQRHEFSGGRAMSWAAIGGLVTGAGMTIACSAVDGTSGCGGVFVAVGFSWLVFGGLAALGVENSRWVDINSYPMALSRYARFPQGWPDQGGRTVAPRPR